MAYDGEYLPVEDVARILKLTIRQATRYAHDPNMRTQRSGRRILYHRDDVQVLAERLGAEYREPPPPRPQVLPAGETLALIDRQQAQLMQFSHQIGQLQAQLDAHRTQQAQLTGDTTQLRQRLEEVEVERDQLRAELEQQRLAAAQAESARLRAQLKQQENDTAQDERDQTSTEQTLTARPWWRIWK